MDEPAAALPIGRKGKPVQQGHNKDRPAPFPEVIRRRIVTIYEETGSKAETNAAVVALQMDAFRRIGSLS
jgi:hypothetical protein